MSSQPRSGAAQVHLALAVVAVLFSLNYIIGKIGLRYFNSFAFAWLRVFGSALLLTLIGHLRPGDEPLSPAQKRTAVLFSVLGVGVNQLMFVTGLSLTSATEAAILITTIPVFTLLGALALRTERATLVNVLGIALAAAGALMILAPKSVEAGGPGRLLGDLFILINCASYGLYLVVSRPLFQQRSPIVVIRYLFLVGSLMMFPFCLHGLLRTEWTHIPPSGWGALAGVILGPTVAGYLLSAWALARAESSVVAAYTYVQPVLASILAVLLLNEEFKLSIVFAAILIIIGVALSALRRPQLVIEPETRGLP